MKTEKKNLRSARQNLDPQVTRLSQAVTFRRVKLLQWPSFALQMTLFNIERVHLCLSFIVLGMISPPEVVQLSLEQSEDFAVISRGRYWPLVHVTVPGEFPEATSVLTTDCRLIQVLLSLSSSLGPCRSVLLTRSYWSLLWFTFRFHCKYTSVD